MVQMSAVCWENRCGYLLSLGSWAVQVKAGRLPRPISASFPGTDTSERGRLPHSTAESIAKVSEGDTTTSAA